MNVSVNYLAVLVGAVAAMGIGALWYSPLLFGKQWMALLGKTMATIDKSKANRAYGITAVMALLTSYVLAHIVAYTKADTLALGLQAGFWVWLGFVATTMATTMLFEDRPVKLYLINAGYHLVNLLVMGAILASWR